MAEKTPMTDIECLCRHLCEERGENPDRRLQDFGRSSHSYPAWEAYRSDARKLLQDGAYYDGFNMCSPADFYGADIGKSFNIAKDVARCPFCGAQFVRQFAEFSTSRVVIRHPAAGPCALVGHTFPWTDEIVALLNKRRKAEPSDEVGAVGPKARVAAPKPQGTP